MEKQIGPRSTFEFAKLAVTEMLVRGPAMLAWAESNQRILQDGGDGMKLAWESPFGSIRNGAMISAVPGGGMLDFVGVRAIVHDLVIRTVSIPPRWGVAV